MRWLVWRLVLLGVVALVIGFAAGIRVIGPLASVALSIAFVLSVAWVRLGRRHNHVRRYVDR